jgi:hypothetical protein
MIRAITNFIHNPHVITSMRYGRFAVGGTIGTTCIIGAGLGLHEGIKQVKSDAWKSHFDTHPTDIQMALWVSATVLENVMIGTATGPVLTAIKAKQIYQSLKQE